MGQAHIIDESVDARLMNASMHVDAAVFTMLG
jgi:hypothetical protein